VVTTPVLASPRRSATLPAIARHAMGDWFLRGNPRRFDNAAEIEQLLELAW
jgi:hypothetical protein